MAAFQTRDNIRETFIGAASTTVTLGGAAQFSRAFSAKYSSGDTFWGVARAGAEISVGLFTYNGTTVAQTTVYYSSNSDAAVSFSSGSSGEIYCDLPAHIFDHLNLIEAVLASAATADLASLLGKCIELQGTIGITSFGTGKNKERRVRYTGAGLTITGSATLICPGAAATLVLATNDIIEVASDNTSTPIWRILRVWPASGKVYLPVDGTAALPAFTWSSDPDTGFYRIGANNIGAAVNGAKVLDISASGMDVTGRVGANGSFTSTAAAGTPNFDSSGSSATVPASGSVQILGNQTAFVVIRENTSTGAYIVGILSTFGGNSILVTSGTFPNSTTPGASAYSFGYDGVNNVWKLYNGSGAGTRNFNLGIWRIL